MYDDLKDADKRLAITEKYRKVFGTRDGRDVLTHMFVELGLFELSSGKSERELGQFDYAIRLLYLLGIMPDYGNARRFVDSAFKWQMIIPIRGKGNGKEEMDSGGD
jgi:hypothetical protein